MRSNVVIFNQALLNVGARYHEYDSERLTICGQRFTLDGFFANGKAAVFVDRQNAERFAVACKNCEANR